MAIFNRGNVAGENGTGVGWVALKNFDIDIAVPSGVTTILVEFIAMSTHNWHNSKYTLPDIKVTGGTIISELFSINKGGQNGSHSVRFVSRSYSVTPGSRVQTVGLGSNSNENAVCEGKIYY